ncbi:MAG: HAMP domain-containing histidine kinase [Lachnospiraceae bacterium]|nr:HAMP domain-containing histidine kinase [Lachnospiraceae bacterium]
MDELHEYLSKAYEDALGSLFFSIYRVNVDTDEILAIRVAEDVKGLVDRDLSRADDFLKMMAEAFYHSHSQSELIETFNTDSLKAYQGKGIEKVERELVRMYKGGYHRVSLTALLGSRTDRKAEVIILLQDIDEEFSDRKTHSHMLQSISNVYETMYYVDLDTDMINAIDNRMDSDIMLTNHGRFSHIMRIYGNNCIYFEDQDSFFNFMSLKHLRKHLTFDTPVLEIEFRRVYDHGLEWIRGEMILVNMVQGMPARVLYVTRNITVLKGKEMAFDQALQALEEIDRDEIIGVGQAAASFYKRTDFLKRLSKQMQYPINAYLGLANVIEMNYNNPDKLLIYTRELKKLGAEMLHIGGELRDIGEIERGQINVLYEPVPATDFFYSVVEDWREEAEERHHRFVNESAKFNKDLLMLDRRKIKQVIDILVDNAIRYTPDGGRITVSIAEKVSNTSEEDNFDIVVRDSGYGMSSTFLEHIYEPFLPISDGRVVDEQGMGLGLGIAKALVAAMKGTMEIQSQVDVGTIVTVHMRCKNARVQTEAYILEETESTAGHEISMSLPAFTELTDKRILYFGEDYCTDLLDQLSLEYDKVSWSDDLISWFDKSRVNHYQMVIVDATDSEKNEWEIPKGIHQLERADAPDIPVVAIINYDKYRDNHENALDRKELAVELENRGFCDILFDPCEMEDILKSIAWWIK